MIQKKLLNDSKINFDFNAVDFDMSKKSSSILSDSMKLNKLPQKEVNKNSIFNINLDLDEVDKKMSKANIKEKEKDKDKNQEIQNKQENEVNKSINNNQKKIIKSENEISKTKENKEEKLIKNNIKDNNKKGTLKQTKDEKTKKYISPFPVPGYLPDENLWEFVCDLNSKDPFEINNEKETINNKDREIYTGIRHLLKKKEKRNKEEKGVSKKINKKKKNKDKKSNK